MSFDGGVDMISAAFVAFVGVCPQVQKGGVKSSVHELDCVPFDERTEGVSMLVGWSGDRYEISITQNKLHGRTDYNSSSYQVSVLCDLWPDLSNDGKTWGPCHLMQVLKLLGCFRRLSI